MLYAKKVENFVFLYNKYIYQNTECKIIQLNEIKQLNVSTHQACISGTGSVRLLWTDHP